MGEPTDTSLTSTCDGSSQCNPPAQSGQKISTPFYRVPLRRRW
jgi:hypothetical protein